MSDVEGAAPYDDGEERREKKKKKSKDKDKDKKKHRTPEEKEARRARKAAKAAASAELDGIISDANLDDDANEAGTPGRVTESTDSPPAASKKSPAAKPKAAWGDVEKGSRGGSKSSATDGGGYVKPARTEAAAHARTVNVFRQKMGVDVHIESDVLEPYDEDDILSQIYNECERKGIIVTRVTKRSKHHAVIEDVAFSMADDLEAMGVHVNKVRIDCVPDYGEFDKSQRDAAGPNYEPFPYWKTGPKELGELSVGIGLYFQSLLWGQRVMLGMFFLGFFTVMTYVKSGMLDEQVKGGELTGLAIPTLGSVAWAHENEFRLLWFVTNSTWDGDDRSVMMGISFLECLLAVIFVVLVGWLSTEQKQTIENIDVSNISLQDYAVKVDYIPRDADPKEIGTHFARFGKVNQVVIGTDIDGVLGLHRKRAAAERAAETAEVRLAKAEYHAQKKENPSEAVQKGLAKLRERVLKLDGKVSKIMAAIDEEMSSGEHGRSTSAFVTYETETAKEKCVKLYKPGNLYAWFFRPKKLRFQGHRMWVHVAPEGSDVIWENLAVIGLNAAVRRALAWLAMIIVLCVTAAAVVYTKSLQNSLPPAISCETPKLDGTLVCDKIWTTTGVTGQASKDVLANLLQFSEQVDGTVCLREEFVVQGQWKGNATAYQGAASPAALYDANGAWTGGFDASTLQDECAAMACFDCVCKDKVTDVAMMYVGLAADDDGYKALCGEYFEGKMIEAGVSAFTAATNIVLAVLVRLFAGFERHHTKSGRESSVMIKLFLLLTINSAVIPLLVFADIPKLKFVPYLFEGPYKDFSVGWYQDVGQLISTTLLINGLVYPMSALSKGLTPKITRGCLAPFAATQRALNALYEGVEFPLSERYAQLMQMVFTGMVFSSGMPCLLPVAAMFCFIAYYERRHGLSISRMAFWKPGSKKPEASLPLSAEVDREGPGDSGGRLVVFNRNENLALQAQRERLPIFKTRDAILHLVETRATTVLVGQTGCGKTTQVPQYLVEAGWTAGGRLVACTQPRRVAAMTVASRVADEMGVTLGAEVGYAVRFENVSTPGVTRVRFCTDGVLLRELMEDPLLSRYSVVMVDEAHERSLATDLLLGLLKKVQRRRPDLRIIIASATIQAEEFAAFFDTRHLEPKPASEASSVNAPSREPGIVSVEGRAHTVLIHYLEKPVPDYVKAAVGAAIDVHRAEGPGDVLVFLTGEEEIEAAVSMLQEEAEDNSRRLLGGGAGTNPAGGPERFTVHPLYAGLSPAQQMEAFRPAPRYTRKIVVASNVAETSVTIEGVVYVVDCCFVKQKAYDPTRGMESLLTAEASRASANQRAGRAGRVRPGKAYRLCTEKAFRDLPETAPPEMIRSDLAATVLQLKALGIDNIMNFEWLSPPPAANMIKALELLYALQAIDDDARLTKPLGMHLAELPLEPQLGKALLVSGELGCVEEMLTVSAYLQVQTLWVSPRGRQKRLDECRDRFAVAEGDAVTALNIHTAWCKAGGAQGGGRARSFADKNMLSHRALVRASDIRAQLARHVRRVGLVVSSAGKDSAPVRRAMTAGFFANAAALAPHGGGAEGSAFRSVRGGATLFIHPGSVLFRARPAMVVYAAAVRTGREYMRDVTAIDPEWLSELAPHFYAMTQRSGNERPADAAAVF